MFFFLLYPLSTKRKQYEVKRKLNNRKLIVYEKIVFFLLSHVIFIPRVYDVNDSRLLDDFRKCEKPIFVIRFEKKKRHLCLFKKGHGIHSFHHKICQHSATCRNIFVCIKRTWNKVANTTLEEKFLTPFRNTYLRCWKIFLDSIMLPMMGIKLPKLDFYKQSNWSYDVLELESNPSQISSTLKTTKKCEKIFLKG